MYMYTVHVWYGAPVFVQMIQVELEVFREFSRQFLQLASQSERGVCVYVCVCVCVRERERLRKQKCRQFLCTLFSDERIYMEVVPALLGLARALQKSAACRRDAFRQLIEPTVGVATAAADGQPHQSQEKCESSGQELDLDAESIKMLLTTVGGWTELSI